MTKHQSSPFPNATCRYGAPMGRMSTRLASDETRMLAVAGPAGEYDPGGAYWGVSDLEGPVWAVWVRGSIREGVCYVRARSREGAKREALA